MSIRKKEMAVKYRSLLNESDGGCKAEHSLDKILVPGCYTVEIDHNGTNAGLPVEFCGEEHYIVGSLIVTDSGTAGPKQNNRVIGQSLTITTRNDKATKVYTRTLADGEWSKWYANTDENQSEDIMQLKIKVNSHAKTIPTLVSGVYWQEWPNTVDLRVNKPDGTIAIHPLPAATTENAGIMTADDKVALDTATSRALRALFIAAGALYNDTAAPITRTAPWGESVQHLPAHYYLNGLGDITEEQMTDIYNYRDLAFRLDCQRVCQGGVIRTLFPIAISTHLIGSVLDNRRLNAYTFWGASNLCAVILNRQDNYQNILKDVLRFLPAGNTIDGGFFGCTNLVCVHPINVANTKTMNRLFEGCSHLKEAALHKLSVSVSFSDSPQIGLTTILYTIQNASPTTAITITLHADAYARLEGDADVVAALEAQPQVSLVSA